MGKSRASKNKSVKLKNIAKKKSFDLTWLTVFLIITCISTILIKYLMATRDPGLPEIDLDVWWGANDTKNNQDTSIRPFRIVFSQAMERDLSKRFDFYREREKRESFANVGFTYGFNSKALENIFDYWRFSYKIDDREKYLNKYDNFKTNIQGLDIHYVHVKPDVKENVKVIPLVLLHGWPSSFSEFYDVIPMLATKNSDHNFVFELIIPSLPGFGYSQAATRPGLGQVQIAVIMRNLMQRIGIKNYYIHSDSGHMIAAHMATLFPEEILGFHSSFLANLRPFSIFTWLMGSLCPSLVVDKLYEDRMYPLYEKIGFYLEESGYLHVQMTKPDTIGIALSDSPVGLAAYILEKFSTFSDPSNKLLEDGGFQKDKKLSSLFDNIMIYWVTNSITSSLRLYKESISNWELEKTLNQVPTPVPTWGFKPRHATIFQPDFIIKWKYPNLLGNTILNYGGHFATLHQPHVLAADLFKAVKVFENFHMTRD